MRGRVALLALATLATIAAIQTHAQPAQTAPLPGGAAAQPADTVPLPPRVGIAAGPEATLTLQEVIRLTLESNNDVAVARLDIEAAREGVRAAEGLFDAVLVPNFGFERANIASASAIGGATAGKVTTNEVTGGLLLTQRVPQAGGLFTFDFTSARLRTSNNFARLNPQFPSALSLNFTQPLFRGRRIDEQRRQILLSKRAVDLTDSQLRSVITEQLTLVAQAYWDLVFARGNLEVQRSALAQARAQVGSNERQVVAGTLAPIDVVEAERQAATFEQTVALAQRALTEAENRLKSLMLKDRQAPLWNRALLPADLDDRPMPPVTLDEAMRLALAKRPELASSDVALAQNDIDQRFYQDQSLPQVNVVGGYALAGLAGTALPNTSNALNANDAAFLARLNELSVLAGLIPIEVVTTPGATTPEFFSGAYGTSLRNLFERRFPTALIQVQMELPLRNRTARANVARTRLVRQQIERQRTQLENVIEGEVRNALEAVQTSNRRLAAAASAHRSAREQYDSERRRFESGLSTVFLVLERQTTFVIAQANELRARADLNQAIASFHRAVGGTLEQHGIDLK